MEYTAVRFDFNLEADYQADLFVASLAEAGFESFENTDTGITAYCPTPLFDQQQIVEMISQLPYGGIRLAGCETIADQDWNQEWERNCFRPIRIGNCIIHSPAHTDYPPCDIDITINPRMSFGTGHHATTALMIQALNALKAEGQDVLDMGCGTGVLAIVAHKLHARHVTAIDIDDWCVRNTQENAALNHAEQIDIRHGGADLIRGQQFDIILANINRNVLLNDMEHYAACLREHGRLVISGFYTADVPLLEHRAGLFGLHLLHIEEQDGWACCRFGRDR
ncbi:MAG: 50S ribosomal protein L11 methyltransferase [Paludibacteraceae bacterium]|nr:50S ribosomal protein L11 methyltransferase [Paludibacteraceae bacterium]